MTRCHTFFFALALAMPALSSADLVAWFPLDGSNKDTVKGTAGEFKGDAGFSRLDQRRGADFSGGQGVFFVPDSPQFALGPSFSLSAEVWVRAWPRNGTSPAGQIVFRGDDRCALDNYSLSLSNDGFFMFTFCSPEEQWASLSVPARLNTWQKLLGTFDAKSRHLKFYLDGFLVAEQYTPAVPVMTMVKEFVPGFSIGNVQNPFGGVHNQPFNGLIRDVRLYNSAVMWDEIERAPTPSKPVKADSDTLFSLFD